MICSQRNWSHLKEASVANPHETKTLPFKNFFPLQTMHVDNDTPFAGVSAFEQKFSFRLFSRGPGPSAPCYGSTNSGAMLVQAENVCDFFSPGWWLLLESSCGGACIRLALVRCGTHTWGNWIHGWQCRAEPISSAGPHSP